MILGDGDKLDPTIGTLDGLFRRAGVRHPDMLALTDPPNAVAITGAVPRSLTYAEADRAISGIAARLRSLGLQTDTIVTFQLANTVESVITLLGILRAGMIAVPLPVLWRQQEMVEALSPLGPKVLITARRIGTYGHADIAMNVAAQLFPVRYVCAFGDDIPDGVVPLDDVFDAAPAAVAASVRVENPAAHVAVITFDVTPKGFVPVARSHAELIAGGLAVSHESGLSEDCAILSTIPVASFGGMAAALMPWLLNGGTLHLHHGFDAPYFSAQRSAIPGGALVVPGPVLPPLIEAGQLEGIAQVLALWRAPERLSGAPTWHDDPTLIDVACLGECAVYVAQRPRDGRPAAIPHGLITRRGDDGAEVPVLETLRTKSGVLAVRGPMVPRGTFPPGANEADGAFFVPDVTGFVETSFVCRLDVDQQGLVITGTAGGLTSIGGYSFRNPALDACVAKTDPNATIVAVPDALLGQRLAGRGRDRTPAFLKAFGHNPLIAGAFTPRKASDAA